MRKKAFLIALLLTLRAFSFENQPWFPFPYEFHFIPSYFISYFSSVQGGYNPYSYNSWNQVIAANLEFNTMSQFDTQIEVECFNTSKTNMTLLSSGIQGRYLLFDDIQGDPVSLAVGLNFRYVPDHALTDPFCPYHNIVNFEAVGSVGKEFDHLQYWVYRLYALAALGQANQGAPWIKGSASVELNGRYNRNQCAILVDSYFGFGSRREVNINQFHGYGSIWHQSVDVSAIYRRNFQVWGTLSFELGYRVYAENYPRNQIGFLIKYNLPFSFF
ncbi:MAG: hypothetical protein K9M07_06485 [Simkaniaceae bacterium]|nr:hypothetical protein [Simkaniaceae bacterium]